MLVMIVRAGGWKNLREACDCRAENTRVKQDESWDREYHQKEKGKNNIIIVHDVLVTGRRIYESVEKLSMNTYNINCFLNPFVTAEGEGV